jgi:NAD(P)H-dependent FMN reductase
MTSYKVGYFVGSLSSTSINRQFSQALIRLAATLTRGATRMTRLRLRRPAGT